MLQALEKIKRLREEKGLTQCELSQRMGNKSSNHIYMLEKGMRTNLSLMIACELAKAFDITLDELVKDTEFDLRKECGKGDRL